MQVMYVYAFESSFRPGPFPFCDAIFVRSVIELEREKKKVFLMNGAFYSKLYIILDNFFRKFKLFCGFKRYTAKDFIDKNFLFANLHKKKKLHQSFYWF